MKDILKAMLALHESGEKTFSKSQVLEKAEIEEMPSWTRYLAILKENGVVEQQGERRNSVYKINKKAAEKYLKSIEA